MDAWGFWNYLFACLIVLFLFSERIKSWWFDRQIKKALAFDRICHLADIGQKDLKYHISETYRFTQGGERGRHFSIQFIYICLKSLEGTKQRNPTHYVGDLQAIDTLMNCSLVEEKVAKGILRIKNGSLIDGNWIYGPIQE